MDKFENEASEDMDVLIHRIVETFIHLTSLFGYQEEFIIQIIFESPFFNKRQRLKQPLKQILIDIINKLELQNKETKH